MRANKPQSAVPSQRQRLTGGPRQNNFMGPSAGGLTKIEAMKKKFLLENSIPQKKKHDKEVTHMQRNTLLEPNNFIP